MISLCTEYWQVFLAQGVAVGLGLGCLFLPSVAGLAHYFSKKKSTALGIASSGGSLGEPAFSESNAESVTNDNQ